MARVSDRNKIASALMSDPLLITLSYASQILWFRLATHLQRMASEGGVPALRFCSDICSANLQANALAKLAAMEVSEIEGALVPLLDQGLLVRGADGAIACPLVSRTSARSEINRINAMAGVEKRRRARTEGQMEMPMVGVVGGSDLQSAGKSLSKPAATASPARVEAKLKLDSESAKLKLGVSEELYRETAHAAFLAAGFDPARSTVTTGIVRQWFAWGATPDTILSVIGTIMARGAQPEHLGYFSKAIREAVDRAVPEDDSRARKSRAIDFQVGEWIRNGRVGPMPRMEDFEPGGKFAVAA